MRISRRYSEGRTRVASAANAGAPDACRRSTVRYCGPIPETAAQTDPSGASAQPTITGILLPRGESSKSGEPLPVEEENRSVQQPHEQQVP